MKIVISKKRLEQAVKNICRVINRKNALPILGDIRCLVDKEKKQLNLLGGDGEAWLNYTLDIDECDERATFCVDASLLKKALAGLKEQPIEIASNLIEKLTLKHETGNTSLPIDNVDEYPLPIGPMDGVTEWRLDGDMVHRVLKRSLPYVEYDDFRLIMNGVLFHQTAKELNIVASDGHILIRTAECLEYKNSLGKFVMPLKVAKVLQKIMSADRSVTIKFDHSKVFLSNGNIDMIFRPIDGRYPKYMNVIPFRHPHHLRADRKQMLAAIRNVEPFANDKRGDIRLHVISKKQIMELSAKDFTTSVSATDSINIKYDDQEDLLAAVKDTNIVKILQSIDKQDILLHFSTPDHPITVTYDDEDDKSTEKVIMLFMPMFIDE